MLKYLAKIDTPKYQFYLHCLHLKLFYQLQHNSIDLTFRHHKSSHIISYYKNGIFSCSSSQAVSLVLEDKALFHQPLCLRFYLWARLYDPKSSTISCSCKSPALQWVSIFNLLSFPLTSSKASTP